MREMGIIHSYLNDTNIFYKGSLFKIGYLELSKNCFGSNTSTAINDHNMDYRATKPILTLHDDVYSLGLVMVQTICMWKLRGDIDTFVTKVMKSEEIPMLQNDICNAIVRLISGTIIKSRPEKRARLDDIMKCLTIFRNIELGNGTLPRSFERNLLGNIDHINMVR